MSRTYKGSKPQGFDYWGKRGVCSKRITKRKERMNERKIIHTIKTIGYDYVH